MSLERAIEKLVVLSSTFFLITNAVAGDELSRAEAAVRDQLKDPWSAQFKDVKVVTKTTKNGTSVTNVCGVVNAKNSYGGYVGFRPFVYILDSGNVNIVGSGQGTAIDRASAALFDAYCIEN